MYVILAMRLFVPLKVDSRQREANGGCAVEYLDRPLLGGHLTNVQIYGGNDSEAFATTTHT